jgi:hypothetical protein
MIATTPCRNYRAQFVDYVNATLLADERAKLDAHMDACSDCRDGVKRLSEVNGLLHGAFDASDVSRGFAEKMNTRFVNLATPAQPLAEVEDQPFLMESVRERLGAAPWWAVSCVMHALVILLAGLISMAIELPKPEEALITITELQPAPKIDVKDEKKQTPTNALASKHDTPPTDLASKEYSDIVVPPDILEKAILGDHFETVNPDMPDDKSAFGNPDAHMFHSEKGNDDAEGGGGIGGASLEDSMIGVGSSGSPGSGGGWGGGIGSGTGVGNGSGHGSFGQRGKGGRQLMVKRHGGSKKTEDAVERAVDWLARHQEPDGHWIPKKFGGGVAEGTCEVGSSGLALLAFLGAGHTEKVGKYKENVQRAVAWFIKNQGASGVYECRSDRNGGRFYGHGIVTMAMSEAAAMRGSPEVRQSAQKAVDYISEIQIKTDAEGYEREGWDYDYSMPGKVSDTSLSSWMALALKSAKIGGLNVDHRCFEGILRWLDATQGNDPYKLGCWYRGTIADVKASGQAEKPRFNFNNKAAKEHALVSANAVMRLYTGTGRDDPRIVVTGEHLVKMPPAWKADGGTCFYHLYYGTLCMFQIGGDGWKTWNEGLKTALLPNQAAGGDEDGSWNPEADWLGKYGGRVYSTAMGALCLEVYYRYTRLNPAN